MDSDNIKSTLEDYLIKAKKTDNSIHFAPFKIDILNYQEPVTIDQFVIRKFTELEKKKYLGIKRAIIDENGEPGDIELFHNGSRTLHEKFPHNLFGAEYVIEFDNTKSYFDNIKYLITAFRLYKTGDVFAPYCFSKNGKQILQANPEFTNYHTICRISVSDLNKIEELYHILRKNAKEKTLLIIERFNSAIAYTTSESNTFIELVSIIESIVVGEPYELRFRFALYSTFILNDSCKFPVDYKELQSIYDLRSKLVHTGKSDKFKRTDLNRLSEITIKIIQWYIETGQKDDYARSLVFSKLGIK